MMGHDDGEDEDGTHNDDDSSNITIDTIMKMASRDNVLTKRYLRVL